MISGYILLFYFTLQQSTKIIQSFNYLIMWQHKFLEIKFLPFSNVFRIWYISINLIIHRFLLHHQNTTQLLWRKVLLRHVHQFAGSMGGMANLFYADATRGPRYSCLIWHNWHGLLYNPRYFNTKNLLYDHTPTQKKRSRTKIQSCQSTDRYDRQAGKDMFLLIFENNQLMRQKNLLIIWLIGYHF